MLRDLAILLARRLPGELRVFRAGLPLTGPVVGLVSFPGPGTIPRRPPGRLERATVTFRAERPRPRSAGYARPRPGAAVSPAVA